MLQTTLSLIGDIPAERLSQLTKALAGKLTRAHLDAHPTDASISPGVDVEVLPPGQIAFGAITSSGVTALVDCLKHTLAQEAGLAVRLRQPNGNEVEFDADNLDDATRALALAVSPPA